MKPQVNAIAGRLSLRQPQRRSLEILDRITEIIPPRKGGDIAAALEVIRSEFPTVTDFEREFPSVCFALATGVGKTRLMGAFISYLHLAHGINNFFVMTPNLTIYNKLIADFTPNTPKYVFKGIAEFATDAPEIITGDNYEAKAGTLFDETLRCKVNIFNISKINSEVRGGKSPRIRFRVLDGRMALMPGPSRPDVTLDSDSFAKLNLPVRHVFVTENETNFLAFPPVSSSIVIFGAGYGWDALAKAVWLSQCSIQYWGDIDTHGFAILDSFRARFPHAESFLMDHSTLMVHESLWGKEADQVVHDLPRLTSDEQDLFNMLRDNRLRSHLRLEQEMIGFGCIVTALNTILLPHSATLAEYP